MNTHPVDAFTVRLARTEDDLRAAQRLRYDVFVKELGGGGPMVDHAQGLERDRFDAFVDHLLLCDKGDGRVVGVYRLLRQCQAAQAGQFYSADEFDLAPLINSGRSLLELGRSCLHPSVRGGMALPTLWSGLAQYIATHGIEILFGVASFHGTDTQALAAPLSLLQHRHLAPQNMRVRSRDLVELNRKILPEAQIDRRLAMRQVPSLIKAYLRLGGWVGQGAFVDHAFNTTDICLVLDTTLLNPDQARFYRGQGAP